MACLNINSLVAHIDQLRIFLSTHKIDILAINETKLDSTITSNEIHISGYDIARRDRPLNGRHGGGVCIFIKNNLNFRFRNDLQSENLELLAIEIIKPRSRPFLVATWYRPPNSPAIAFTAFQNVIDKIDAENSEFYLLGDINCDVSSESPDCNTINLLNICNIFNLSQIISEPTRITNTSKSLIDLCFTNFPDKVRGSGVHSLGISDHSLIYLIRKSN
jgi:exonuclease III